MYRTTVIDGRQAADLMKRAGVDMGQHAAQHAIAVGFAVEEGMRPKSLDLAPHRCGAPDICASDDMEDLVVACRAIQSQFEELV
jgi:hypothetical protein